MKTCARCRIEKPVTQFYRHPKNRDGLQALCKDCGRRHSGDWNRSHPEVRRAYNLWAFYKMTPADFDAMSEAQGGRCAICGTEDMRGRTNRLHVDHDGNTGAVRALLCPGCNTGLGKFAHDPHLLRIAAAYLEAS